MRIIRNGVDTQRFRPDPLARQILLTELGLPANSQLVGMFARFHPQKDYANLVRATGIMLQADPTVHWVAAGDGIDHYNVALKDQISRMGVEANFHLLGSREDMARLSASMDLVTLSSSHGEALPMSLVEAMACATPCVATDVGDVATLISETGAVVPPHNPEALARAWARFLNLPLAERNHLGGIARQRVLQHYSLPAMVAGYAQLYHGIAPKKS